TVRNIYDVQGLPLMDVASGGLLAVYQERPGWLEVEAPGGFPVWVYGRFLQPTDRAAVYEVTTNGVNMRPNPDTSAATFPLAVRLQAGDQVTAVELPDPSQPLADTWVQVWTPPGAGAWVQASRVEELGANEDGALLWSQAEAALFAVAVSDEDFARTLGTASGSSDARGEELDPSATGTVAGAGAPAEATAPLASNAGAEAAPRRTVRDASSSAVGRAADALTSARRMLADEQTKPVPDFGAVDAALRGVLELAPDPLTRAQTVHELEKVKWLAERERLRVTAERAERERLDALADEQSAVWAERPSSGAVWNEQGTLEEYVPASGRTALRLTRGGEVAAELVCSSGRYDLEIFVGARIEVRGLTSGAADLHPGALKVDVSAIEILSVPRR
ncbi:MAG: SH3 domain-containing protein, partial [Planctomycetota bacterium]